MHPSTPAGESTPTHIHELVRLLKAPSDPPSPGGSFKIDIARRSWTDPALSVANKAEVLVEWLLGSMGRGGTRVDQDAASETQVPVADPRYWSLLQDALSSAAFAPSARPLKAWLLPLLYRTNLAGIVMKLISLSYSEHAGERSLAVVYAPARAVVAKLWPLVEKRAGMDALTECFATVLEVCVNWGVDLEKAAGDDEPSMPTLEDDLTWICAAVIDSYRDTLVNFGNKKKLYTTFLSTHLPLWLRTIPPSRVPRKLQGLLYLAVTDTLFSLDALKQPFDTFLEAFACARVSHGLVILPRVFSSRLSATNQYRTTLFPASSRSASSTLVVREAVRADAMEAWKSCWTLLLCDALTRSQDSGGGVDAWTALVGILGVIEKERLFDSNAVLDSQGAQDGADGGSARPELLEAREQALVAVERACQLSPGALDSGVHFSVSLALDVLGVLTRIEYELIGEVSSRVLAAVVNLPPVLSDRTKDAAQRLLSDILEYHSKTRTLPTYILTLLSCFNHDPSFTLFSSQTHPFPSVLTSDTILVHLSPLSRALRVALTPTQLIELGPAVLEHLRRIWTAFSTECNGQAGQGAKKRKFCKDGGTAVELDSGDQRADCEAASVVGGNVSRSYSLAVAFARAARIVSAVLANLPSHAYTSDAGSGVWNDVGEFGWEVVWACVQHAQGESEKVALAISRDMHGSRKTRKKRKRDGGDGHPEDYNHGRWVTDVVASATLRFLYDVRARLVRTVMSSTPITLGDSDILDDGEVEELLDIVGDEGTTAELVLETVRTLLSHVSRVCRGKHNLANIIFNTSLDLISRHLTSTARWSGISKGLPYESLGVALLYVVVDRWIDVVDALASKEVLEKLVSLLLSTPLSFPSKEPSGPQIRDITSSNILLRVLQSAQFWELHNMRSVLLSSVLNLTAPLSKCTFPSQSALPSDLELSCAGEVYALLVHVPSEYFTRSSRTELMKRALTADVSICTLSQHEEGVEGGKENKRRQPSINDKSIRGSRAESKDEADVDSTAGVHKPMERWLRHLVALRTFLQRAGQFATVLDHSTSRVFIEHLLSPTSNPTFSSDALRNITLDLVSSHLAALLRAQVPEAASSAASVISDLATARPFSQPSSKETWRDVLVQATVSRLIEHLRDNFTPQSLAGELVSSLKNLHKTLVSSLATHAKGASPCDELVTSKRIDAWSRTLSLGQWLDVDVRVGISPPGVKLATTVMRNVPHRCSPLAEATEVTCPSVLALLFEELRCIPGILHTTHNEIIVALYSVHSSDRQLEVWNALDAQVAKAVIKLPTEGFSHLIDIVAEGIGDPGLAVDQCQNLIHLSKILLHCAPQGTLKIVQNFMAQCLNRFTGQPHLGGGSSQLRAQYLELVARHCSDRPAAVRSTDLGSIWSLLCKVLSGAPDHDSTTCFAIFHHIASIISALVRLRRDLVIYTLPHLAFVLRQLMMITRRMRPQLGAKQSRLVANTFPSWISASQPLTIDEGRALGRLLTSLTVKTVPRAHTTATAEAPRAESLAKPFAKHAGSVLTAYIDALDDPLAIIPFEMRRELEPGLFSLCEMLGKHNRDSLMVSTLGSGGKTVMKALWKEYEKQRYVGKG